MNTRRRREREREKTDLDINTVVNLSGHHDLLGNRGGRGLSDVRIRWVAKLQSDGRHGGRYRGAAPRAVDLTTSPSSRELCVLCHDPAKNGRNT